MAKYRLKKEVDAFRVPPGYTFKISGEFKVGSEKQNITDRVISPGDWIVLDGISVEICSDAVFDNWYEPAKSR